MTAARPFFKLPGRDVIRGVDREPFTETVHDYWLRKFGFDKCDTDEKLRAKGRNVGTVIVIDKFRSTLSEGRQRLFDSLRPEDQSRWAEATNYSIDADEDRQDNPEIYEYKRQGGLV